MFSIGGFKEFQRFLFFLMKCCFVGLLGGLLFFFCLFLPFVFPVFWGLCFFWFCYLCVVSLGLLGGLFLRGSPIGVLCVGGIGWLWFLLLGVLLGENLVLLEQSLMDHVLCTGFLVEKQAKLTRQLFQRREVVDIMIYYA